MGFILEEPARDPCWDAIVICKNILSRRERQCCAAHQPLKVDEQTSHF